MFRDRVQRLEESLQPRGFDIVAQAELDEQDVICLMFVVDQGECVFSLHQSRSALIQGGKGRWKRVATERQVLP